jgi:outer membrane protein assembly factor BamA
VKKYYALLVFIFLSSIFSSSFAQVVLKINIDSAINYSINTIKVTGNKKTKNYIVTRDITFKVGDTIKGIELLSTIDRTQKNIYNAALYATVKIEVLKNDTIKNAIDINIVIIERWYIFPIPVFELYDRNIKEWRTTYNSDLNRVRYGIRFTHYNFSGRRDQLNINLFNGFSKELYFNYSQPYADKKLLHGFVLAGGYSSKISINYIDSLNLGLPRKLNDSFEKPDYKLFKQEDYFFAANYSFRSGNYARHEIGINYNNIKVTDTIIGKNNNYFTNGANTHQVVDFNYSYNYSKLDFYAYPLIGDYYRFGTKLRIGKSNTNQLLFYATYGTFNKITPKFFYSTSITTSFKFAKEPQSFYNLKTSNFEIANIRGLEQYLIYSNADFFLSIENLNNHFIFYNKKLFH